MAALRLPGDAILYVMYGQKAALQSGIADSELHVELDRLVACCNRPTIAALMSFAEDVQAMYCQDAAHGQSHNYSTLEPSSMTQLANDQAIPAAALSALDRDPQPSSGSVMSVSIKLAQLQLQLNYESPNSKPLMLAGASSFDANMLITTKSARIELTLRDLEIDACALAHRGCCHRICALRGDNTESVVNICLMCESPAACTPLQCLCR